MAEQELRNEVVDNQGSNTDYNDYISAINEIKQNSVSREKYDQLLEEKKGLIEALKSGGQVNEIVNEEKVNIDELRKSFIETANDCDNLAYVTNVLKLREALLEAGERDPFLPNGRDYKDDYHDHAVAEKVAQVFKECVEYADGDSQIFTQELMRRTNGR